ncbi:MAG: bacillithiol system redox-active protein YtxJ [Flavobacterium sp.]
MSFFDKLFGSNKPEPMPDVFWNYIEEMSDLDRIEETSYEKPVAIFKHSTTCGISRMAWNLFSKDFNIPNEKMELHYLDLLAHRSVSNEVASRFGVTHQSPQVIVIKDGKAIYSESHESIDAHQLEQFV